MKWTTKLPEFGCLDNGKKHTGKDTRIQSKAVQRCLCLSQVERVLMSMEPLQSLGKVTVGHPLSFWVIYRQMAERGGFEPPIKTSATSSSALKAALLPRQTWDLVSVGR